MLRIPERVLVSQEESTYEDILGRLSEGIDTTQDDDSEESRIIDQWTSNWKRLIQTRHRDSIQLRLLTRHGIPDILRGPAWRWLTQADDHLDETRTFAMLVKQSYTGDKDTQWAIQKDIRRTFPKHVLFETVQGQEQLSQVLCAYAVIDPHVGYCQGMGFIAAFLLCYTSPEEAFWILRAVMCRPEYDLRSMLMPGMPKFSPAMKELSRFIQICLPDVAAKLRQHSMDPSIFASQWFITLFAYSMPFSLVARVWDLFFYLKRWSIIFRVSIVLLELVQGDLLKAKDIEAMLAVLKTIPDQINKEKQLGVAVVERAMRLNLDEDDARVMGNVSSHNEDEEAGILDD